MKYEEFWFFIMCHLLLDFSEHLSSNDLDVINPSEAPLVQLFLIVFLTVSRDKWVLNTRKYIAYRVASVKRCTRTRYLMNSTLKKKKIVSAWTVSNCNAIHTFLIIMRRSNRNFNIPPPPGKSRALGTFEDSIVQIPARRAKMVFKCPTLSSDFVGSRRL